jgi:hypothetical protein
MKKTDGVHLIHAQSSRMKSFLDEIYQNNGCMFLNVCVMMDEIITGIKFVTTTDVCFTM